MLVAHIDLQKSGGSATFKVFHHTSEYDVILLVTGGDDDFGTLALLSVCFFQITGRSFLFIRYSAQDWKMGLRTSHPHSKGGNTHAPGSRPRSHVLPPSGLLDLQAAIPH